MIKNLEDKEKLNFWKKNNLLKWIFLCPNRHWNIAVIETQKCVDTSINLMKPSW